MNYIVLTAMLTGASIFGCAIGFWRGWIAGTEQTEKRWSEIVTKAEDRRKYGT